MLHIIQSQNNSYNTLVSFWRVRNHFTLFEQKNSTFFLSLFLPSSMISSFYYYFHSRSSFFLSCQSKWKHIDHGNQGLNYVVADRLNSRARVTRRLHTKNEQFQMGKEKRIVTQSTTDERLNSLVTIVDVVVAVDIVTGLFSTLILSHSFIFVPFIYFVYFVFTNFYCVSSRSPICVWDLHRVVLHRRIHRQRRHLPLLPMMMMRMMLQLLV